MPTKLERTEWQQLKLPVQPRLRSTGRPA